MKRLFYILLIFSCSTYVAHADDFFNVEAQNKAAEREAARVQADYARQQEELRQAEIRAAQERTRQQEKRVAQERAEANRIASINAKIVQDKADARERAINEERQKDKAREQAKEDEERAYQIRVAELKLQEAQALADQQTADADLKKAITAAKMKRVDEEVDLQHKRESSNIDVIQSEADATRNISSGAGEMLSGLGSKGKYEFYAVIGLVFLALIILIGGWLFYSNSRKSKIIVKSEDKKEDRIDPIMISN